MNGVAILLVFMGGALGAGLRAGLASWLSRSMAAHWAILAVNLTGSLAAGALLGLLVAEAGGVAPLDHPLWTFAAVGVLGGYTTVSSFALQAVTLGRRAGGYVLASTFGCPLAAALGWGLV
ncbi:MAG: fluoride efflux transporter FluC [Roseinatronobacter sp.]